MAYESMTYESILHRMIDRITTDYPNLDTREGSIIFNALAPAAVELAIAYAHLDAILNECFVSTASREYLLIACSQMGMDTRVFDASQGTHKGVFNVEIPIGSRWNHDLYNYTVTEYIGLDKNNNHEYKMICETEGSEPNTTTGDLTAITYITNDLTYAKVTECLIEGEDETSDEDIRMAYYDYVNSTASDGNVKQYERWCNEYPGIGNYRIFPLANGDNTVEVSILNPSNRAATDELVAEFQKYLDPNSSGMGDGVAPIGSRVTVTTAQEREIEVGVEVVMKKGYSDISAIEKALTEYFASISYKKNTVSYMSVGAVILGVEGVESIKNLALDGYMDDVELSDHQIPVLGASSHYIIGA